MGKYSNKGDFKKGKPPGPGRPKRLPDLPERIDRDSFNRKLNLYLGKTREQLAAMMKNPDISVIDHMIMSIAAKSIVHGDHSRLTGLLDYLVPKKQIIEHAGQVTLEQILAKSAADADKNKE